MQTLTEIIKSRTDAVRAKIAKDERTRIAIAKAVGLSPVMLSYFMNGRKSLSPKTIDRMFCVMAKNKQEF